MVAATPLQLVLIEDDPVDVELFRRTARRHSIDFPIIHAADGAEGLEVLRSQVDGPCLVFLDLNMQGMNGHDFLNSVRADERLKRHIIFVLSSSTHGRDIERAYDRHVAGYFNKSDIDEMIECIKQYAAKNHPPSVDQ